MNTNNYHHLIEILFKIQSRLSIKDRQRLHVFLGGDNFAQRIEDDSSLRSTLSLILYLWNQENITEKDMQSLINAFNQLQCKDFAQNLKQIQSKGLNYPTENFIPLLPEEKENELLDKALGEEINYYANKNVSMNSSNRTPKQFSVVLDGKGRPSIQPKPQRLWTKIFNSRMLSFLSIIRSLILIAVIVGGCFLILRLEQHYSRLRNAQTKDKDITSPWNMTIQSNDIQTSEDDRQSEITTESTAKDQGFTEESRCYCKQLDENLTSTNEVCEDGRICGAGYTCICSK